MKIVKNQDLDKSKLKVGWILSGSRNTAGARIQGWNVHDEFIKNGINSEIISSKHFNYDLQFTKEEINNILNRRYDIIIFQKIQTGENFFYFIQEAHKKRIKLVFIGIDDLNVEFAIKCDVIIVVSKYLKRLIPKRYQKKAFLVFDSYEHPRDMIKKPSNNHKLRMVFVSNNVFSKFPQIDYLPQDVSLTIIGPSEERVKKYTPDKKMFTETPYKFKYIVWSLENVHKEILKCDVGVIPYRDKDLMKDYVRRKSNNRLVLFMSLGIPTIASPTPEYKRLIKQGINGFIANNPKEWIKYLEFLRDNPEKRKQIGEKARLATLDKYSPEAQAKLYLEIIQKA